MWKLSEHTGELLHEFKKHKGQAHHTTCSTQYAAYELRKPYNMHAIDRAACCMQPASRRWVLAVVQVCRLHRDRSAVRCLVLVRLDHMRVEHAGEPMQPRV